MITLISLLVLAGALALLVSMWVKIASSARGERDFKQCMQRPFVPLDKETK